MKWAWALLLATACGGSTPGPQAPLSITMDRATSQTLKSLQITVAPSDRYFCPSHADQCANQWVPAGETIPLSDDQGGTHPARVIPLTADPSGQTFQITGIPATKNVLVIIEGLTFDDPPKLGAVACVNVSQITSGDNAPIVATLIRKDPPLACDPRYEK